MDDYNWSTQIEQLDQNWVEICIPGMKHFFVFERKRK
jgi:hypothetical protein